MRRIAILWAPAAAWALFLLFLGTRPPDALPDASRLFEHADKVAHLVLYGVLGLLWARARDGKGWAVVEGAMVGVFWGGLDEWLQSFVGREPDRVDLMADALGAAVGAWIGGRTFRRAKRS